MPSIRRNRGTSSPSLGLFVEQLEQLTAIGMLLDPRPWLVVIEPELRGRNRVGQKRWSDDELREASKGVKRTFLRRQDFVARSAPANSPCCSWT